MSRRRGFGFAVIVAGMMVAMNAGVVLGAQGDVQHHHAPNAAIRFVEAKSVLGTIREPGAWVGADQRNGTATDQTLHEKLVGAAPKDAQYMFQLRIHNPGAPRSFDIHVSGTGSWAVGYFAGKRDITSAVSAGTYETPMLHLGQTFVVTLKVHIGRPGTSLTRLITVSSATNLLKADAVRLAIDYSSCGC